MGTIKKSINFIEEADALNELDMNAMAGGFAQTDYCPHQKICLPSSCLGQMLLGEGPVAC